MAWDNTVPATGHSGSQDYTPMRQNFQQMQASFSVNHEPLGSGGGTEGYHTQIQLAAPVSDPNLSGNVTSVYSKGTPINLFFQNSSNVIQITNSSLTASSGQGMLPGGLQIRAGFKTGASPISFTAFPNGFISASLTSFATPTQFDITGNSSSSISFSPAIPGGAGIYWIAIGN